MVDKFISDSILMPKSKIPPNENQRLVALRSYQILDTLPEQEFNDLVELAAEICATPIAVISLVDSHRQWFKAKVGIDTLEISRDICFCSYVVAEETILIIPDATKDNRFADNPVVIAEPSIRFYAGVPLRTPDNYVLGSLCVMDYQPKELTLQQIRHLEALSHLVMSQLELRRNNQASRLLVSIVESSNHAIITNTLDGIITSWNPAAVDLFGYSEAEAIGQKISLIFPPDPYHLDEEVRILERLKQGQKIEEFETVRIRKDGTNLNISVKISPLKDKTGRIVGFSNILHEITDYQRVENALQKSELRFRQMFDSSVVGLILADFQGGISEANDRFLQIIGYSREEFNSGMIDLYKITPPEYFPADLAAIKHLIEHGEIEPWEKEYYHKDGRRIPILIGAALFPDSDNQTIYVIIDITKRKQAEQIIRQQAKQELLLREITQRIRQSLDLQTIFDTACQEIRQFIKTDRVGIFKFYPESNFDDGEFVAESVVEDFPSVMKIRVRDHCFGENYSNLYAKGKFYAVDDIYHGGLTDCHHDILAQFQVKANLIFPLTCGEKLWGLLCLHQCSSTRHWNKFEIDLTQQLSDQLVIAIQQASLYDQIQHDVLNRKRTEAELQKLWTRLTLALKSGAIGYWEWDLVHHTKFWDERMYQLYGLMPNAGAPVEIENWARNIHPDDRTRCQILLQQAILGEAEYDTEFRVVHNDGSIHFIKAYGTLIRDSENKPQTMIGINFDISDRKQSENALQESQKFLQTVLDTFPLAVFWKNRDSVILGCNQLFAKVCGYKSSLEAVGKSSWDFGCSESEVLSYLADDRQVMESGTGKLGIQETMTMPTGEQRWLETNKIPLLDLLGNVVGVVGTFQDITDRKQAEIALVESEAFNRQLVEEFPIGLASCQLNGQFVYVNPTFAKILGRTVEECKKLNNFDITPKQYAELEAQQMKLLQETGRYGPYEKEYIHKDGHLIPVSLTGLLIKQKGETLIWSSVENISERKQVEEKLQRTNAALARATRLKDEFLANMSHELRTPLNAILGMAEMLQEQVFGILHEPQIEALQTIESSAYHLLSLINDILDVAKIESGQIQLECTSVPVEILCASSMAFIKEQALKKNIQLETKLSFNLPNLLVDQRRIRQVLINLLSNAVKFTLERGKVILEVFPLSESKDIDQQNYLRISVIDTGIGISPENISKLFQPFVQIDSALNREYTGTGLGLTLVKQIVELHGGKVGLTSEFGVGSCFTIDLPCEPMAPIPDQGSAIITTPHDYLGDSISPSKSSHLILLVEDNEANLQIIKTYLEIKRYSLLFAKNGQEAIKIAKVEHPALIIMDIQLPGMDGLEAIQHIRRDVNLVSVPIIALTALAMKGDRERCLAAGANEYLSKPVKLKELATIIQKLLPTTLN